MKIKKVLNQNAVLVLDEGQEKVAVGIKGVGFNKTKMMSYLDNWWSGCL